jgi:3',5'-cyclic AMP phosphodiesterase CpdA
LRDIADILNFREDISPFLVHLTRDIENVLSAHDALMSILHDRQIYAGETYSDARWSIPFAEVNAMDDMERRDLLSAVCFTETPLNEIHCLFDIQRRAVNLQPYGLVFSKNILRGRGVSPVLYFNNVLGDKDPTIQALCTLRNTDRAAACQILPLVSIFGQKLQPPGVAARPAGGNDWLWEREWRYPNVRGPFNFDDDDVFVGLCPHDQIDHFEEVVDGAFAFVDPHRNLKYYAAKLVAARRRMGITVSVV